MHKIILAMAWFVFVAVLGGGAYLGAKFAGQFSGNSADAVIYGAMGLALVLCVTLFIVLTEGAWEVGRRGTAIACGVATAAILSLTLTMSMGTLGANRTNVVNKHVHQAKISKNAQHDRERIEAELAALPSGQPVDRAAAAVALVEGSPMFKTTAGCSNQSVPGGVRFCRNWARAKADLGVATRRETLERELRNADKTMQASGPEVVADGQTYVLASLTGFEASSVRSFVVMQWAGALALAEALLLRVLLFLHGFSPAQLFRMGHSAPQRREDEVAATHAAPYFAPTAQPPANAVLQPVVNVTRVEGTDLAEWAKAYLAKHQRIAA